MFQGEKPLRTRNWGPWPFAPDELDAVLLTHAHLDHSGMLPVLCRAGFTGSVFCTESTAALAEILLTDSGRIHEDDARHANRHGYSRHHPAQPLYTEADARAALAAFAPRSFMSEFEVAPGVRARFHRGGHILGASWLELTIGDRRIVFSGDLGRPTDPIMHPPAALEPCDYLIIESTYGDRQHAQTDPAQQLLEVVDRTRRRRGMVLIPAFAVGRAQLLLYLLWQLKQAGKLNHLPIFLDSPMAVDATELFQARPDDHRLTGTEAQAMCAVAECITSREQSRALNDHDGPMVVISASGMMSGGRVLHHLRVRGGDPRNTILFTGYQAAGTRGADILAGASRVKIHGLDYPVRAEIDEIASLSAHADQTELIEWAVPAFGSARRIFVTHGERSAATELARCIKSRFDGPVQTPALGDRATLD
jgi:metallo-beta-lactamase family protein